MASPSPWGDVSVFVDVGCPTPSHRRALWIASTNGALPMPAKPKARASSMESVDIAMATPPPKDHGPSDPPPPPSSSSSSSAVAPPGPHASPKPRSQSHGEVFAAGGGVEKDAHERGAGKDDAVPSLTTTSGDGMEGASGGGSGGGNTALPRRTSRVCSLSSMSSLVEAANADSPGMDGIENDAVLDVVHTVNALSGASSIPHFGFASELRRVSGGDVRFVLASLQQGSVRCYDGSTPSLTLFLVAVLWYVVGRACEALLVTHSAAAAGGTHVAKRGGCYHPTAFARVVSVLELVQATVPGAVPLWRVAFPDGCGV